jgi:hypothetical protein
MLGPGRSYCIFTAHVALFSTHAYMYVFNDDGDTGRRVSPIVDITLSYCRVPEFDPFSYSKVIGCQGFTDRWG